MYNVTLNANGTCEVLSDKDGVDIYMREYLGRRVFYAPNKSLPFHFTAILSVFIIVLVCSVLAKVFSCTIRRYWGSTTSENTVGQEANPENAKKRMRSLDTFRG